MTQQVPGVGASGKLSAPPETAEPKGHLMTTLDMSALGAALDALPHRFPGPGGVAGVVKDGEVVAARAWGHKNVETGAPMTRGTRLQNCLIAKQFTCAVLLAEVGDPSRLDAGVRDYLPDYRAPLPPVRQLCDNQSGLRDYWALTVLHGAMAEQEFRREDALPLIARMKTGHFAPGTRYSYCNCNFRIVSELVERESGAALEDLYRRHVWGPAGMGSAVLTSDTRRPEDGVTGYEGTPDAGYFPARNGIFWIGDAGISAALDDMLAYECWIDATREDPDSLYRRISVPPSFADGNPARYACGLAHGSLDGVALTGHGGALRGFRAQRFHAVSERLSVVVMFNHQGSAHDAALSLIRAALGRPEAPRPPMPEGWAGQWLAQETGLLARIAPERQAAILRYATTPDCLTLAEDGALVAPGIRVSRTDRSLRMERAGENADLRLEPVPPVTVADGAEIAGRWHSDELGAKMIVEARDGGVHARFEGMLGAGRMERLSPAGPDIWLLATRRSMDAPAPGDWTLRVRRDAEGRVAGLTLGCWLARGIGYSRGAGVASA